MATPLATFHLSGRVPRRMWAPIRATILVGYQSWVRLVAGGKVPSGPGLFLLLVPPDACLASCSSVAWKTVPVGPSWPSFPLYCVVGGKRCPSAFLPCPRGGLLLFIGERRWGLLQSTAVCGPGDDLNFLAFHPVEELLPAFSYCFLYGPLKGPLRHPNLLFACRPLLSLLMAWPSSLLLDRMSSLHHRFDLAQMVITRTCLLKISARAAWTRSISPSRPPTVHLAARVGRAPDLAHQMFASVGSDQSSSFSLPSLSFKDLPGRGDCGGFPRARSRPLPFYHFVVRCRGLPPRPQSSTPCSKARCLEWLV